MKTQIEDQNHDHTHSFCRHLLTFSNNQHFNSTRVSNELGAGNHKTAKLAVWIALSLVIIEVLMVGIVLMAARGVWANLYTNEAEVVSYISIVMPVLALSNIMDGIQGVLSGYNL